MTKSFIKLEVDYTTTAIEENLNQFPKEFAISSNYPNPFNPSTTVQIAIPEKDQVDILIYNILGEKIYSTSQNFDPGYHQFTWAGVTDADKEVSSGMYILKAYYKNKSVSGKMILMR